jgi:uncharacterized paraquat-inducible protein A
MKADAGVSVECKECGHRTTFPALKVVPGVKCERCAAMLKLEPGDIAAKATMIGAAAGKTDVSIG